MEASKTLRRPENHQDFETLCKKLWGEIWRCPEIQKNGRSGQRQDGVDIFGIPQGEDAYYGIQCKLKNENKGGQVNEDEIRGEIDKAHGFVPKLKKLYFATTAPNDSKIQGIVRGINLEHKSKGLFEVHLFAWESIVELIDENKGTHDWYMKNQSYKTNQAVIVSFANGKPEIACIPKFSTARSLPWYGEDWEDRNYTFPPSVNKLTNLSYFPVSFTVLNSGMETIEEFKLELTFLGNIQYISNENTRVQLNLPGRGIPENQLFQKELKAVIVPRNKILVPGDSFISNEIFIKSFPRKETITIGWKLLSRNFQETGELRIDVSPEIDGLSWVATNDGAYEIVPKPRSIYEKIVKEERKWL